MKKRSIIIDKKFQFKLAASMTSMVALTFTVLIVITVISAVNNRSKLEQVVENQTYLYENQNELFKTLLSFSQGKTGNIKISVDEVNRSMEENRGKFSATSEIISDIIYSSNRLFLLLVIFSIVQSVSIFYLVLRRTHKSSGPLFVLNRYITEIREGTLPEVRPLRPGDDCVELFDNFREMVEGLKQKRK